MKLCFLQSLCAALLVTGVSFLPAKEATPVQKLSSDDECHRCYGYLLPGSHVESPHAAYRIDSDLPEIYTSNGVLYSTRQVLPPFSTKDGTPVSKEMRTQVSNGFETIDDSFEVFLYHLSIDHQPNETRRIVVLVENEGDQPVTIDPRESLHHGPNAGNPTSVESDLTRNVLLEKWDGEETVYTIAPGSAEVISYTRQIGAKENGPDSHKHSFVTGIIRADVSSEGTPDLVVNVVSIPGSTSMDQLSETAVSLLQTGADSGEGYIDLSTRPSGCQVRRVGGTSPNRIWKNDPMVIDAANLPDDKFFFMMAKFARQSVGCEESIQSVNLLLHPPYAPPDSVGNYMMEYSVTLNLINTGEEAKKLDLLFGKDDAPIGLGWQLEVADEATPLEALATQEVTIDWAGERRVENDPWYTKTMLDDGPIMLQPGDDKTVSIRLMVVGTSSLPWQLHIEEVKSSVDAPTTMPLQ